MTRRISQSITPTAEDVAALRGPFVSKGANDPVIKALREYFKQTSPVWLAKLDERQELTRERLAVLYGDRQQIAVRFSRPGLRIEISLPLELATQPA